MLPWFVSLTLSNPLVVLLLNCMTGLRNKITKKRWLGLQFSQLCICLAFHIFWILDTYCLDWRCLLLVLSVVGLKFYLYIVFSFFHPPNMVACSFFFLILMLFYSFGGGHGGCSLYFSSSRCLLSPMHPDFMSSRVLSGLQTN